MRRVAVFCGSSFGTEPAFHPAAVSWASWRMRHWRVGQR